jgi:acyl-coenzyme A thioesterase PaaI-like protein
MDTVSLDHLILAKLRRAIALNRVPGYHFCGNFLDMRFEDVRKGHALVSLRASPQLTEVGGRIHPSAFAVLADFAMASAIRTADDPATRLATVSINLQWTGAQALEFLNANGKLLGFHREAKGRLGQSTVQIYSEQGLVASGLGSFMVLPAPSDKKLSPIAWINQPAPEAPDLLPDTLLNADESQILQHGLDCLARCEGSGTDPSEHFFEHFLNQGFEPNAQGCQGVLPNGPHLGNRVGHVQGGITLGFGMASAQASLGESWRLSTLNAAFISPGQGHQLSSNTSITHQGKYTAAAHTHIYSHDGDMVLELLSTHVRSKL